MSWHFSRALVEESLQESSLGGDASVLSKSKSTHDLYSSHDKTTDHLTRSRYGMTSQRLTDDLGEALLTWFRAGFPARTFLQPGKARASKASGLDSGWKWPGSLAKYDPDTRSWKTRQCSLLGGLEPYSETWPRWGTMRDGEFWEQMTWEPRTSANASGYWPTPIMWPTPKARDHRPPGGFSEQNRNTPDFPTQIGGKLNPLWVEWLMGWPLNWSSLESVENEYFRDWQETGAESISDSGRRQMRSLWWAKDPSETPYRPQSDEQRSEQHSVAMPDLPQQRASKKENETKKLRDMQDGIPAQKGETEAMRQCCLSEREREAISRTAVGVKFRVDRLKALGNGQVPQCAAEAWTVLSGES